METSNNVITGILITFCWLNAIAVILGCFRSDAERIYRDLSNFTRLNKWYVLLGLALLLFTMSPFTIPYSISNVINRLKNKNK